MKKLLVLLVLAFMTNIAVGQTYKVIAVKNLRGEIVASKTNYKINVSKTGTITIIAENGMTSVQKLKIHVKKRKYLILVDMFVPKESSPVEYAIFHRKPKKYARLELYKLSDEPYTTLYLEKVKN